MIMFFFFIEKRHFHLSESRRQSFELSVTPLLLAYEYKMWLMGLQAQCTFADKKTTRYLATLIKMNETGRNCNRRIADIQLAERNQL